MADDEDTTAPAARKVDPDVARLRAEDEAARIRFQQEVARRETAGRTLGASIVATVSQRMKAIARPKAALFEEARRVGLHYVRREPRTKDWRGPTHGEAFSTVAELEAATLRECAAGYAATWGCELTPESREWHRRAFRISPTPIAERERDARDIYGDLRNAIMRARAFAKANHNRTYGSATCALDALWEHLPELPETDNLPGYVKSESHHARLVLDWQHKAELALGHSLTRRELAEVCLLLGIDSVPYKKILGDSPRMQEKKRVATAADVIEWQAKYLDRTLRSLRDEGGREVGARSDRT